MYIRVQVTVILGRVLVPLDFHEGNETFSDLFCSIKAGKHNIDASEELKGTKLVKTFVGNKIDSLIVSGVDQFVIPVCSQFGIYVKFSVEILSPSTRPSTFEEIMSVNNCGWPNAFEVISDGCSAEGPTCR